jgi:hypothetical protein
MVPQGFSSARACSRFVVEEACFLGGALGVDRGEAAFLWLGLSAGVVVRGASRAGFAKAEAELRALCSHMKT